jgi:hypothetical protein
MNNTTGRFAHNPLDDPKYQLKSEMLWSAKVPGTRSAALLWTYEGNGNRLTQHDDGVLTNCVYASNHE